MAEFITTTLMDSYAGGPHITETQIGLANQATFGPDDYVLGGGRESEAQVLTNNSIRIFDAVYCIQGRRDVIPASGYTDVTIANGTQGMNRNDIIVRRYRKDESSEIESTEYAVIKGTPNAGEALDPEVTIGDIRTGATLHEMKLYRVKIEGLNITAVEPLFNILKNMAVLQQEIAKTNKDLADKLTELNKNIACSPSAKRQETLVSFQRNQRYKIEHTGQIQFACAFSSTQGYCRIYVYNSSGEIVYREQLNPAPVPSNEVTTGQLAVFEGWEFLAESYNALVAGTPKYTLTY